MNPASCSSFLLSAVVLCASAVPAAATPPLPQLVKDISAEGDQNGSAPRDFCVAGGTFYFTANDRVHGRELWKTDGTEAGTVMVKDIYPGMGGEFEQEQPYEMAAAGSTLYFTVEDGSHGRELWKSDGTSAGTVMVKDIRTGVASSKPTKLTAAGSVLYFSANNGTNGEELWKSDGTPAGTVLVKDISSSPASSSSYPYSLTVMGGKLYFTANDGVHEEELWVSDGTLEGTKMLKDIYTGPPDPEIYSPYYLVADGNTLYFTANDGISGEEVWKSDGTPEGTVLLKDIHTGADYWPHSLTVAGGVLYFVANDGDHGPELWKSDGTPGGTIMVKDIYPGGDESFPTLLTPAGSTLYFAANDGVHGTELWKTGGSLAGAVLVSDIKSGPAGGMSEFSRMTGTDDGELFFTAGEEPWMTDGSVNGAVRIGEAATPEDVPSPETLVWLGGRLYFSAYVPALGRELFVFDPAMPAGDSDHDGLADAWETTAFGTLAHAAADDPDHDGQSNAAEQLTGSNPADGKDLLRLACVPASPGSVTLSINRVRSGLIYKLEASATLTNWETLRESAFTAEGPGDIADPRTTLPPVSYYRVTVRPAAP